MYNSVSNLRLAHTLSSQFTVRTVRAQHVLGLRFAHGFAHIYACAAALLFLRSSRSSALFVGVRFDVHKEKAVASCACAQNFAFATVTQLRTCKHRRRRLHKTIRSQTHVNVHANVDARSVAFGQSLPLLPIATAGAQNAPASFSLVSLRSQTKKAAVKNSCKVSLEERIRILIRIHIRILIFIRIRIKISSIFVL